MTSPKISLIVPVYNAEKYLSESITSLINQTYKNIEIILINDGSTDKSGLLCDEFSTKFPQIITLHTKNGGASNARNLGIENATGDFIAFVDADDKLEENYIEILYDKLSQYNADICICGYKKLNKNCFCSKEELNQFFSNKEIPKQIYIEKNIGLMPWAKLIRRDLIGDTKFLVGRINEDELFCFELFAKTKKMVKVNLPLYLYTVNLEGVTYKKYDSRNIDIIPISFEKLKIVKNTWNNYLPNALYSAACSFIDVHIEYARRKLYNDDIFKNKLLKDREDLYQFFHTHEHLLSDLINKKINFYYNNTGKIMLCDKIRFAKINFRRLAKKIIKGAKI